MLVHGIGATDKASLISFWGRIPGYLKKRGYSVYVGNTDSWGSFDTNAALLKETIDKICDSDGCDKVNIIAHSKGGLDSRYMISKYEYSEKVASLVTMSTPHRGSELADLLLYQKATHSVFAKKAMKVFGKIFLDKNPDPFTALVDLSTINMERFNKTHVLEEGVYFKSFFSVMHSALDDLAFFFPYLYLSKTIGYNDGIVSQKSALFGPNIEEIQGKRGGVSHADIVDARRRTVSGVDMPEIYLKIAQALEALGF